MSTSTTATPTAAVEETRPTTSAAGDEIAEARRRIDALDDRIIALVRERMAVSAEAQQARLAAGGRRLNLSREMEILDRYHRELGKPGTSMAMTVLELSRGRA